MKTPELPDHKRYRMNEDSVPEFAVAKIGRNAEDDWVRIRLLRWFERENCACVAAVWWQETAAGVGLWQRDACSISLKASINADAWLAWGKEKPDAAKN